MLPVLLIGACNPEASDNANAPEAARSGHRVRPNQVHWKDGAGPRSQSAVNPFATSAHLTYYGGPVISNVKVYAVFWGANVNSTVTSGIGGFYSAVTASPYIDWLSEYNTPTQSIGRGSFGGAITIAPNNTSTSLQDTDIQTELDAQINAGVLPTPDANMLFMVNFPPGISINQGGSLSCQAGGFCAYHGTYTRSSGSDVYYGVLPDMAPGSGCNTGCGNNSNWFNNQTSVASHEMVEAITDAAVGLATTYGPPLAWYDQTNGEIGDICNATQGSLPGTNYIVQKEWSNSHNACIVSVAASNDFSISLSPSSQTVNDGGTVTYTVATAINSGSAQTVNLSIAGLPAGVTASFSPASMPSGSSSTLTLTAAANAASASATFTVTAAGASSTHAATANLTVSAPVSNDFSIAISPSSQTMNAGASTSYTVRPAVTAGSAQSVALSISGLPAGVSAAFGPSSVTAGGSSTLTLTAASNAAAGTASFTVTGAGSSATHSASGSITVSAGSSGGGSQLIVNGGFENGSFSSWVTHGSNRVTSVAHSGSHGARVGSTGAYNGDSSIYQQISIPASGSTTLSFWYELSSLDTIQYDWQRAYVTDSSNNVLLTVFNVCETVSAWTESTTDLTAFAGKTVRIWFLDHDDGYPGDPTYMRIDDVSVINQ
jgi:hypothetical protein